MRFSKIFRAPELPREAAKFIAAHFADQSVKEYFSDPRFEKFLEVAKTGTWADAAQEYRNVTNEDIRSSVIAAEIAKKVFY